MSDNAAAFLRKLKGEAQSVYIERFAELVNDSSAFIVIEKLDKEAVVERFSKPELVVDVRGENTKFVAIYAENELGQMVLIDKPFVLVVLIHETPNGFAVIKSTGKNYADAKGWELDISFRFVLQR